MSFQERAQEYGKTIDEKVKEINVTYAEDEKRRTEALFECNREFNQYIGREIDGVIGDGTCLKVFDSTEPDFLSVVDFLEQLLPIAQKYANERAAKMNKYSAKRIGNSK